LIHAGNNPGPPFDEKRMTPGIWIPLFCLQDAQVREAVSQASDWKSYRMTCDDAVEGAKSSSQRSEFVFEKDKGFWFKSGKAEGITVDGRTISRGKDGSWSSKGSGPEAPPAPHQSLRGLERSSRVDAAEDGDLRVYTIALQAEGAASILGNLIKDVRRAVKEPECTAKLTVDQDGHIAKLEVSCAFSIRNKAGEETPVTVRRSIVFTQINQAKLEVPVEAQKALDGP
jgi:hypothetical protein